MKITILAASLVAATCAAAPVLAADCPHRADRQASIDVAGARSVRVESGSGELRIEGRDGASRVEARGTACASDQGVLDRIRIATSREGDVVVVRAEIPERASSWSWHEQARLDLTVLVPRTLALKVQDGSGSAEIRNVGALSVDDGSGDLTVADVAGDVFIEDGSGSLELRGVTGNVRLRDGSGSIDVREVSGSVTVEGDGSGSIDVSAVKGNFTVAHDGSGGISHRQVAGEVRIPDHKNR